jgi:hypothetical protein
VGGQIVVGGIVPAVRRSSPATTKVIAQAFGRVAWPAFVVAVLTGMWAMMAKDITKQSSSYQATLLLKIGLVVAAGAFAAVHSVGKSKAALAIGGALGLLTSLGVVFLGTLLHTAR